MRAVIFSAISFCCGVVPALCQQANQSRSRPDIPGTFLVEVGVNSPRGATADFSTGFWGSRTVNVYYQYEVGLPIFARKLSFVPGVGLGMDRYKFKNNLVMEYEGTTDNLVMSNSEDKILKSQLVTNYVDVPLGIRFTNNPDDPARSFRMEAGLRGGLLISSFTKTQYEDDGETIKIKTRRPWNLNKYRYGVYLKTGFGNFGLMGYYNLSTLFNSGKAPEGDDINTVTVGISLSSF